MKKISISILLFILSVCGMYAQTVSVNLSGHIKGLNGGEVVLLDADQTELERVKGEGDAFAFQAEVVKSDGRAYYLYVPALGDLGPSMNIPTIYFLIDNEALTIEAVIKNGNLEMESIKGSPMMDEYNNLYEQNSYHKQFMELLPSYNEAFQAYNGGDQTKANMDRLASVSKELDDLHQGVSKTFYEMIPANRNSHALFLHVHSSVPAESIDAIEKLLKQFDPELVKTNYYAQALTAKVQSMKGSDVGAVAPELEVLDIDGNKVKLSSLRGKYVLVDFWASWCAPCRREIPNIKQVYADYKDKGLEVLAISVDSDEKAWRKALEEENMPYPQWWDSAMSSRNLYNYKGIPFIILISPEGVILEKQLHGEKLRQAVKKYVDSQPVEVTVSLPKPYEGKAFMSMVKNGQFTLLDSLQVSGSSLTFKTNVSEVDEYRFSTRPYNFSFSLIAEPGASYEVKVDADGRPTISTRDGKEQLLMNEYEAMMEPLAIKSRELSTLYEKLMNENDEAGIETLMKDLFKNSDKSIQLTTTFIKDHPKSFAAIVLAGNILTDKYKVLKEVYETVDTVAYAYSSSWQSFKNKLYEAASTWIEDKPAPEFTTTDLAGNQVNLSDYRGKYVLLDFWASWCRPCRTKMKELKEVYPQLQEKGIVVFSINLDEKKAQWEKATEEDGILWLNTGDLQSFKDNKIAQAYNVTGIPTLFVIDPNGKIISQNPSIQEILDLELH